VKPIALVIDAPYETKTLTTETRRGQDGINRQDAKNAKQDEHVTDRCIEI
jgi:hypothetical protein